VFFLIKQLKDFNIKFMCFWNFWVSVMEVGEEVMEIKKKRREEEEE